ncbi:MAG: DUF1800 domain-containing protein [Saprospiraceae bacterium]|nr:DUF1800 domain-containing protein [Saprospiraceae bacterium]
MPTNEQKVKHLLNRAGFGIGPHEWRTYRKLPVEQLVDLLIEPPVMEPKKAETKPEKPVVNRSNFMELSEKAKMELKDDDEQRLLGLRNGWLYSMANAGQLVLQEKMTLFWHGHFACKCRGSRVARSYLNTLRTYALHNFADLLLAVAKEPAMIRFLNNQQNRKESPNENFARELLELFTIGEGNYSEQDIKEAARAFTGWSSNFDGKYIFRRQQHDYGHKSFMGSTGRFNGEDIIKILLQQKQTAYFVASRIYKFFVSESQNRAHIAEISDVLYDSGYDIAKTMRHVFTSSWFYDREHVGSQIKSPVELLVQYIKLFDLKFSNKRALLFLQNALGQVLFDPPNVAGWPSGKAWINNSTLMLRLNLAAYLLQQEQMDHASLPSLKATGPSKIVRTLQVQSNIQPILDLFYGIDYKLLESRVQEVLLTTTEEIPPLITPREQRAGEYARKLIIRTVSLPEFQMA